MQRREMVWMVILPRAQVKCLIWFHSFIFNFLFFLTFTWALSLFEKRRNEGVRREESIPHYRPKGQVKCLAQLSFSIIVIIIIAKISPLSSSSMSSLLSPRSPFSNFKWKHFPRVCWVNIGLIYLTENIVDANIFSNAISDVRANITTDFHIFAFPPLRFKIFKYFTSLNTSKLKVCRSWPPQIVQNFTELKFDLCNINYSYSLKSIWIV